jgi:hypothetical protein
LKSSKAKNDLEFITDNADVLRVKMGAAKLTLAMMPPEDFIFEMPKIKNDDKFPVDAGLFLEALDSCMHSLGNDTSSADYTGVTLIRGKDALSLFSTDRGTVSHGAVKLSGELGFDDRVILPTAFCQQLLRIAKGAKTLRMEINDEYVIAKHNNVTLYSLLKEPDRTPIDFRDIIKMNCAAAVRETMIPIPTGLESILDRACIVTESAVDKTKTVITLKDGTIKFYSKSERGEVSDLLKYDTKHNHPPIVAHIDPKRMKDGYGRFDQMGFTKYCCVMTRGKMVYLVSLTVGG